MKISGIDNARAPVYRYSHTPGTGSDRAGVYTRINSVDLAKITPGGIYVERVPLGVGLTDMIGGLGVRYPTPHLPPEALLITPPSGADTSDKHFRKTTQKYRNSIIGELTAHYDSEISVPDANSKFKKFVDREISQGNYVAHFFRGAHIESNSAGGFLLKGIPSYGTVLQSRRGGSSLYSNTSKGVVSGKPSPFKKGGLFKK